MTFRPSRTLTPVPQNYSTHQPIPPRLYRVVARNNPEVEAVVRSGLLSRGGEFRGPSMRALGWRECCGESPSPLAWNLLWSWSAKGHSLGATEALVWQRANHFDNARHLTRKDLLKKRLERCAAVHAGAVKGGSGSPFAVMPTTYVLPGEYAHFAAEFASSEEAIDEGAAQGPNLWIIKPIGSSRGRGICLVDEPNEAMHYHEAAVIQRYVPRPLLLAGYKFDLRLYVLVKSFVPLEAYLHAEGFARVATTPYTTDASALGDEFVHLTNSSIQMRNLEAGGGGRGGPALDWLISDEVDGGTKCSLTSLWPLLEQRNGVDRGMAWARAREVVLAALFAVADEVGPQPSSFELFGFDVLFDEALCCWLLEVNASPAMEMATPLDRKVKSALLRDIVAAVDPPAFDRAALLRVLKRRAAAAAKGGRSARSEESREVLQRDMSAILGGRDPRGDADPLARDLGGFECIAPSKHSARLERLRSRRRASSAGTCSRQGSSRTWA